MFAVAALLLLTVPAVSSGASLQAPPSKAPTTGAPASNVPGGWLTYHDYNNRTGYSGSLPALTNPAVSWTNKVQGSVYAEPLYYAGLVYVATEQNNVYALNATTGAVAWSSSLGTPATTTKAPYFCSGNGPDIKPTVGVTGTPVINPGSRLIYVAALISNTGYELFALNLNTGAKVWQSLITAPGFNYLPQEQRGALALANNVVYVPFGGYSWNCFNPGPRGWVIGMSAGGSGERAAYEVPATPEADIWDPEGVSVDSSGHVYTVTGDSDNATFNFGNSVIKLSSALSFTNTNSNYFAQSNWLYTNTNDLDLGSTGATFLPGNFIFAMGKYNTGYILSAANLGGIGGEVYSHAVCGAVGAPWPYGAWGATSYANGVIYVPCGGGLEALQYHQGPKPTFASLWNDTGYFAGPPIIAAGAVWEISISGGVLYALNPQTGAVLYQTTVGPVMHFSTPSAGGGHIFLAANQTVYGVSPTGVSGTASVTVQSQNTNGQKITGYEMLLYNSAGSLAATGFTPAAFTLNDGQAYTLVADSYGSCNFDHWADTGSTSNSRTITISTNTALTAVYNCGTTSSSLTVSSQDQNGKTITGYEVVLYSTSGAVLATGFTPTTFTTTAGQSYQVGADSYGACTFSKWTDGVTADPRPFTATSSPLTLSAVYSCASASSTVAVTSVNQNSAPITGYETVLYSSSGSILATGFTPAKFTTTVGSRYGLGAESYGNCIFSKWSDGVTANPRTFTATSSPSSFTAAYLCT